MFTCSDKYKGTGEDKFYNNYEKREKRYRNVFSEKF
jgi:hypothetical protein